MTFLQPIRVETARDRDTALNHAGIFHVFLNARYDIHSNSMIDLGFVHDGTVDGTACQAILLPVPRPP